MVRTILPMEANDEEAARLNRSGTSISRPLNVSDIYLTPTIDNQQAMRLRATVNCQQTTINEIVERCALMVGGWRSQRLRDYTRDSICLWMMI